MGRKCGGGHMEGKVTAFDVDRNQDMGRIDFIENRRNVECWGSHSKQRPHLCATHRQHKKLPRAVIARVDMTPATPTPWSPESPPLTRSLFPPDPPWF